MLISETKINKITETICTENSHAVVYHKQPSLNYIQNTYCTTGMSVQKIACTHTHTHAHAQTQTHTMNEQYFVGRV